MRREIRPAAHVGPFDVVEHRVGDLAVVAVPELVDAMANLCAAGFTTEIIHYERDDRENPTPW